MRYVLLALAIVALSVDPVSAQERVGGRAWGQWGTTSFDVIQVQVKCDGYSPFNGGQPTRWRVNFKNLANQSLFLDYVVTYGSKSLISGQPRRVSVKPGKTRLITSDLDTDCDSPVQTLITNVRLGVDDDSVPYLVADRERANNRRNESAREAGKVIPGEGTIPGSQLPGGAH